MRTPRCCGTVRKAQGRLADEPDLIFNTSVLRSEAVTSACRELGHVWRERLFTPPVTLWAFIGQALNSDSSCKQAVARVLSHFAFGAGEGRWPVLHVCRATPWTPGGNPDDPEPISPSGNRS